MLCHCCKVVLGQIRVQPTRKLARAQLRYVGIQPTLSHNGILDKAPIETNVVRNEDRSLMQHFADHSGNGFLLLRSALHHSVRYPRHPLNERRYRLVRVDQ